MTAAEILMLNMSSEQRAKERLRAFKANQERMKARSRATEEKRRLKAKRLAKEAAEGKAS